MYPIDRRKLAIHVYSLFSSLRKTARILQVSHSTVSRWLKSRDMGIMNLYDYKQMCSQYCEDNKSMG